MEKLKIAMIFMTISCTCTAHAEISWFQEKDNSVTLHVFIQHIGSGPSATAFIVAATSVTSQSPTKFGLVTVADEKLTAGPEFDSTEVGRVQGLSTSSDMKLPTTSEIANFFFSSGKYNGSTISVVGRHQAGGERELPVVGGTGGFRFARGYAVTTAYPNEDAADRTVLEYWIHVTSDE